MAFANSAPIRIAGAVLVGGLVTGMLLAMAMPTQMKRKAETWRDLVGLREVTTSSDAIPVYAPPQDLTPPQWQTAAQEYPMAGNEVTALDSIYPDTNPVYQPEPAYEPPPSELPQTDDTDLAAADDDAASTAQAASAAADDVQVQMQEPTSSAPAVAVPPVAMDAA